MNTPTPDPTETARLHDEILSLRAELTQARDLLRSENQRANAAIERETTAEQAALEAEEERDRLLAVPAVPVPSVDRAAVRAEAFQDAANGASLNVHSAAAEGVRRWLLALADAELRRMAAEAQPAPCSCGVLRTGPGRHLPECPNRTASGAQPVTPDTETPRRGDQFEAWLKAQRDEYEVRSSEQWRALDEVLDTYRLHADTRTPLGEHVCEGQVVGDCECLEPPAGSAAAPAKDTPLCGKDRGISGVYYRPCARYAGHAEAYCRSADGEHMFLAAPAKEA